LIFNHKGSQRIFTKVHKGKYYMNLEEVFKKVLDSSFQVHSELGPGLLESAYLEC